MLLGLSHLLAATPIYLALAKPSKIGLGTSRRSCGKLCSLDIDQCWSWAAGRGPWPLPWKTRLENKIGPLAGLPTFVYCIFFVGGTADAPQPSVLENAETKQCWWHNMLSIKLSSNQLPNWPSFSQCQQSGGNPWPCGFDPAEKTLIMARSLIISCGLAEPLWGAWHVGLD